MALRFLVGLCSVAALLQTPSGNEPAMHYAFGSVYVIRHGEKIPDSERGADHHLSGRGLARAQHVKRLWGGGASSRFPTPRAIFANLAGDQYGVKFNSVETVAPLAASLGLQIDANYSWMNNSAGAAAILHSLLQTGGPVLVAWESWNIPNLIRSLGCNSSWLSTWEGNHWSILHPHDDFDPVFILNLHQGECASLRLEHQHFHFKKEFSKHVDRNGVPWIFDPKGHVQVPTKHDEPSVQKGLPIFAIIGYAGWVMVFISASITWKLYRRLGGRLNFEHHSPKIRNHDDNVIDTPFMGA